MTAQLAKPEVRPVGPKSVNPLTETMRMRLNYDELTNCMRCGFCQPACPTFKETGYEAASPRGRIALMKAVVDGLIEPTRALKIKWTCAWAVGLVSQFVLQT